MKKLSIVSLMALLVTTWSSCQVVEGIFKAGVWVGILIVVGIIALIVFIVSKATRK